MNGVYVSFNVDFGGKNTQKFVSRIVILISDSVSAKNFPDNSFVENSFPNTALMYRIIIL